MGILYDNLRRLKYSHLSFFKVLIAISQLIGGKGIVKSKNGIVLNCGGPRSGSTLLNIIIKEVLVEGLKQESNYIDNCEGFRRKLSCFNHLTLVKTHRYFWNVGYLIRRNQIVAFMTHRDMRDVSVSLLKKGWIEDIESFVNSKELKQIEYTSLAYASLPGMHVISYDELVDDTNNVISQVATRLGVELTVDKVNLIAQKVSADNVKKKINAISASVDIDQGVDESTGLHVNHIHDPVSGKWKKHLNSLEASLIARDTKEYNQRFGYECE